MAARPMLVTADVTITYDGVSQRIPQGTVIDVPSPSTLNTLLGANITALTSQQATQDGGVSVGPFMRTGTGGGNEPSAWPQ